MAAVWRRSTIVYMFLGFGLAAAVWGLVLLRSRWPVLEVAQREPSAARVAKDRGLEPPLGARPARSTGAQVWAVLVGIDRYRALPPCHAAVRGMEVVRRWLVEEAGWGASNVLLLTDAGSESPGPESNTPKELLATRANLEWAFRRWLPARLRPGDVVVVYFAGHAVRVPSPGETSGRWGQERLLPVDGHPSELDRTGWSLETALDGLRQRFDTPIVCWLDTSLDGRGTAIVVPEAPTHASGREWLARLTRWPGVTAWLAADGRPAPEPATADRLTPFTTALRAGLGSRVESRDLLSCLDWMVKDSALLSLGFRAHGGIAVRLSLWPNALRPHSRSQAELLLQRGHADRVGAVGFTPDGERLVSAGLDGTVKVWQAGEASLALTRSLASLSDQATCLAMSTACGWVVSGDALGGIAAYDLSDGREAMPRPRHRARVEQVNFLPGGTRFVSRDARGAVWWWDLSNLENSARILTDRGTELAVATREGRFAFAIATLDGAVQLFDREGHTARSWEGLGGRGGRVLSLALDSDGTHIAAGDDRGRVTVLDLIHETTRVVAVPGAVHRLLFNVRGELAIHAGDGLTLVSGDEGGSTRALPVGGRVGDVAYSPDGRVLACTTAVDGRVVAWRLGDSGHPDRLIMPDDVSASPAPQALSLTFSPDGSALAVGDGDGGLRVWDLEQGKMRAHVPSHRGRIAGLAVSPDGRFLLQITRDARALVWDLGDGRSLRRLDGEWTAGAFLPGSPGLVLTARTSRDVAIVGPQGMVSRVLETPPEADSRFPSSFDRVAVSPDGQQVGAAGGEAACVWDLGTGQVAFLEGHEDHITALDVSADGRWWLTASEDGSVRRFELHRGRATEPAVFTAPPDAPEPSRVMTVARFRPGAPGHIAAGTRDGKVLLWDDRQAHDRPQVLPGALREVRALSFSSDGRWLAAGGPDPNLRLWDLEGSAPRLFTVGDTPHHLNAINALVTWPGSGVLASGSDDTTVRLWRLAPWALLGTLAADPATAQWLAYTPEPGGLFDGSPGGERQVTWRTNAGVLPLDALYEDRHRLGLMDELRRGRKPPPPTIRDVPAPLLWIDPPAALKPGQRDVELTIRLGGSDYRDVRLYHDYVAVRWQDDFRHPSDRRLLRTTVRLHGGRNRFFAMAGKAGAVDGRSGEVVVESPDSESPGRLHVLALGVGRYANRPLQFAAADARGLAGYLLEHPPGGSDRAGLRLILTDDDGPVTPDRVAEAFRQLREAVRNHPEDTLVVFLAGHSSTLAGQFCMFLSGYRFPEQGEPAPGSRGGEEPGRGSPTPADPRVLPFAELYAGLLHLDCLRRLVIIDACHAEAVLEDVAVRRVQEFVEQNAHRTSTSYILAARPDGPATEVAPLKHGLLTYVLLRGMGDKRLPMVPDDSVFAGASDADRNGDRRVSTEELRDYASVVLPRLAALFPAGTDRLGRGAPPVPGGQTKQEPPRLHYRANAAPFPLVEFGPASPSTR